MKKILLLLLLLAASVATPPVAAAVSVVTTLPAYAAIAQFVGGNRVEAQAMVRSEDMVVAITSQVWRP